MWKIWISMRNGILNIENGEWLFSVSYHVNDALVCVHSGEKNFIPQYYQKKRFIGGADMQPAQATKNESREHWSQSGMFIRVIFQHVHTITHRLAFNCTEKNRPRIFKETNYLFEIMNIFVYIKIVLELKYQLRM